MKALTSKTPIKVWLLRILLVVIWLPLAAEFWVRCLAPQAQLPRFVVSTEHGIRGNMKNQVCSHSSPDYDVSIRTNSRGMRADEEFAYEKSPGTKRIVVLGDSFGFGYGVNLEETSLSLLEKHLESDDATEIEIINLSVSGFSTAEELIALETEGVRYQPDLVLVYWTLMDPVLNERAGLFEVDSSNNLVRKRSSYLPATRTAERLYQKPWYRILVTHSHLYSILRIKTAAMAKYALSLKGVLQGNLPDVTDGPRVLDNSSSMTLARALLQRMETLSVEAGAKFAVLAVPERRSRTFIRSSFPKALVRDDLHVIEPLDSFLDHEGELLYWENSHGHWTPLGCRLVANVLHDEIRSRGLLSPAADDSKDAATNP